MATLRQIVRRIRSIQSTAKTTRAMSLVAGSKMRRAQQMALSHRPYADQLRWLLADVVESLQDAGLEELAATHPLLARREVKTPGLVFITPDRGLCGGLNTNLLRTAGAYVASHPGLKMVAVGRKGIDFFSKTRTEIIGNFSRLGDYPSYDDVRPISRLVMDAYTSGEVDSVAIIYPRFINTMAQAPDIMELLPVTPPEDAAVKAVEYIYEPGAGQVLSNLLPRFVEIQVYRAVLELAASEQSARMVAMRAATDAANEMISELTLLRNKVRQEQITKELLDITGGVEAMAAR
ncbi:MAG TPA: ATP synthase F1 subunit gamma [Dehalococcoidia bacterium]|nr:ATP synthase F1 subunit gamma [Dehalococcoidia bacterium]